MPAAAAPAHPDLRCRFLVDIVARTEKAQFGLRRSHVHGGTVKRGLALWMVLAARAGTSFGIFERPFSVTMEWVEVGGFNNGAGGTMHWR